MDPCQVETKEGCVVDMLIYRIFMYSIPVVPVETHFIDIIIIFETCRIYLYSNSIQPRPVLMIEISFRFSLR